MKARKRRLQKIDNTRCAGRVLLSIASDSIRIREFGGHQQSTPLTTSTQFHIIIIINSTTISHEVPKNRRSRTAHCCRFGQR
jgi:hypothetical protein